MTARQLQQNATPFVAVFEKYPLGFGNPVAGQFEPKDRILYLRTYGLLKAFASKPHIHSGSGFRTIAPGASFTASHGPKLRDKSAV
jgi:hypothetical protein